MRRSLIAMLLLTAVGLAFSGYLSAVKLFTNACALGETCPYFLGKPACWYGFTMYAIMFLVAVLGATGKMRGTAALRVIATVAAAGIVFAGSFGLQELASGTFVGVLGLSTCAYGLILYVIIFGVAISQNPFRITHPSSH